MDKTQFRKFLITLLDDENGINKDAYFELEGLLADSAEHGCDDIMNMVQSADGRFYLPEDHGLAA